MHLLVQVPKFKIETVKSLLVQYDLKPAAKRKRPRNSSLITFENIIVNDIFFGRSNSKRNRTLFANVSEIRHGRRKTTEQHHSIEVKFFDDNDNVQTVDCTNCDKTKVNCNAVTTFVHWIQRSLPSDDLENVAPKEHRIEPQIQDCYVLIKKENNVPLGNGSNLAIKDTKVSPVVAPEPPVLAKLKKEPVHITALQLESAQKLSMISLIRAFQGTDPDEFLKFCTARMKQENCETIELLTVEQADTDLWHELRKGRITASRMQEASRCTMLNGSLTNKIMGISSGFSFAMKRGTDLEGHVLAELQKEYPDLRGTGLVLDPQFPWMGASPDGICDEFVLEIKCPYTEKTHQCYVDVKKLSKKYFTQIQLQMHMTHKPKALLGVAALDFEKTRNVTKVWIDYDEAYVEKIMAEAYQFWCQAVFKALLKKRNSKK